MLLLAGIFTAHCGTTALISKKGGETIEGKIIGNDSENVYIQTMGPAAPIKKIEITDIDHPGNGVLITGLGILAYGAANIAVGSKECASQGASFCMGVFTPAVVGLGMSIWGYVVWSGSGSNATDPGRTVTATPRPLQMRPMPNETIYYSSLTFNY